jgi:hypothetical protein
VAGRQGVPGRGFRPFADSHGLSLNVAPAARWTEKIIRIYFRPSAGCFSFCWIDVTRRAHGGSGLALLTNLRGPVS